MFTERPPSASPSKSPAVVLPVTKEPTTLIPTYVSFIEPSLSFFFVFRNCLTEHHVLQSPTIWWTFPPTMGETEKLSTPKPTAQPTVQPTAQPQLKEPFEVSDTEEEEYESSEAWNYFPELCPSGLVGTIAHAGDCQQYYGCKVSMELSLLVLPSSYAPKTYTSCSLCRMAFLKSHMCAQLIIATTMIVSSVFLRNTSMKSVPQKWNSKFSIFARSN